MALNLLIYIILYSCIIVSADLYDVPEYLIMFL